MTGLRIAAGRLLADAAAEGKAVRDQVIEIADGRIAQVGPTDAGTGSDSLVMPGIANAHDHGRGLRRLAYGALDDALEVWLAAASSLHPPVDPYLVAAAAFSRMATGGVTGTVHCHMPQRFDRLAEEANAVARAAGEIGLRIAFVVPMADRNRLAYGADDAVLARLGPEDEAMIRDRWLRPAPPPKAQVALADEIAARIGSDRVDVQFGPFGLEWASDDLLSAVAEASRSTGRRIHMHCQETRFQRRWVDRTYPEGFLAHLDRLGVLSPRLTLAHCVWLRPEECELLAERGVTIAINSSSNLRLGSGIAPVAEMVRRGVRVAFGMDALTLDDDDDMLRELRLADRLHGGTALTDGLPRAALFKGAMTLGHEAIDGGADYGRIAPGAPADLVVLDHGALARDLMSERTRETDLILGRATRAHVRSVVAGGREIVRDGRVLGLDAEAVERELLDQARAGAEDAGRLAPAIARYQEAVRDVYLADGA